MTNANVFTPPFDIQILKLVETMVVISRLGTHASPWCFGPFKATFFPQKLNKMENKMKASVQH
jgi:hypothetical protein